MLKNHGYYRVEDNGVTTCIISADNGVFQFIPPASADGEWEIKELLSEPASDAVLIDLDGDGEKELGVLSPFHGDEISIYKKGRVYTCDLRRNAVRKACVRSRTSQGCA